MKETRKQKIDRQRGRAADRAFDPIRKAIDDGRLVIKPGQSPLEAMIDASVRCTKCGAQGIRSCDCWS